MNACCVALTWLLCLGASWLVFLVCEGLKRGWGK